MSFPQPDSRYSGIHGRLPGIVPEPDRRYGDRFGRTPGIVPESDYKLTDINRGQQMQDSVKQFYDSLDSPGIRDRVDAFVRGLGETGEDLARIPLAGSPRTIRYSPPNAILKSPDFDSPYMDQLLQRGFRPLSAPQAPPAGPQLPGFV